MIQFENFLNNENIIQLETLGNIQVLEYLKEHNTYPGSAIDAYFASKMKVRQRQALIKLQNDSYTISAGAMQWTTGTVEMSSDVKGLGDFIGKSFKGAVTKESGVKPKYQGTGFLMLEPTYKHLLLEKVEDWDGGIVLEDGLFLACETKVQQKITSRSIGTAVLSGEGMFNLSLIGSGNAILESPIPREDLVIVNLENDEIRIDGSYAIAWSNSLQFRVEKSSKSLLGSAVSGEGLVNVYRGTGKILMAPLTKTVRYPAQQNF